MSKTFEIISKYTSGEITLEQANEELKKMKAGFYLDPAKNVLTPDEVNNGTAGLLDTGTGTLDKVAIDPKKMELTYDINEVNADGTTNMYAVCIIKGKTYEVKGHKLVEC